MKAHSIYREDVVGYEYDRQYALNYSKAIMLFNDLLRKTIKDTYDTIGKENFSEEVANFKKWEMGKRLDGFTTDIEIVCRKCPFIIYKKNSKLIARVYSWDISDYEYREQDITTEEVVLEKIEMLE